MTGGDTSGNAAATAAATDPRIYFAAERTLLAWVRTGLAMMGFGFVVARFGLFLRQIALAQQATAASSNGLDALAVAGDSSTGLSLPIGTTLVALGVVTNLLAALQYARTLDRLRRGETYEPSRFSLAIGIAVTLAVIGMGMAIYLLTYGR